MQLQNHLMHVGGQTQAMPIELEYQQKTTEGVSKLRGN